MSTQYVNHLANEKSPYLLQHAHNPIDWYPWGEAAFAKAKAEDKPIFFSCGYSTCHWCHVMERESFEDDEVAAVLNSHFVAIKVDREERPDVDHIYMEVCQALTGQGGWPLTVILTPDKKPVFAGTYFPKTSKWGRPGLMDILLAITKQWEEKRQELTEHSEEITRAILHRSVQQQQGKLSADMLDTAFQQLEASFDSEYGGFGSAPKFPMPQNILFLLRYWRRTGKNQALDMAEKTLAAMHQGGIYDHLGYGFARYSTDRFWLAPHFEKMLYDNALLCFAYLEAYQCTGNEDFARVAEEIIAYILRDMTSPDGAFYSAEDADSEGVEGKFYVFTREEIVSVLGQTEGDLFAAFYGISAEGNFEHGTNILNYTASDLKTVAAKAGIATAEMEQVLAKGRAALYQWREQRVHPYKDDKILTAWNGLMIAALAKAARVLNNSKYADAAKRALHFVKSHLTRRDGRLMARYRDGETAHLAYLDDYAFLLWGLFEMYQATFDPEYIGWALELSGEMTRLFWDEQQGGFYFYGSDGEQLLTRPKEVYDGAIPSGNSVASWVMLRLGTLTGDVQLTERAERLLESFAGDVQKYPKAYTFYLMSLDYFFSPQRKLVIASGKDAAGAADMLSFVNHVFLPDTVVAFNDFARQQDIETILPALLAHRSVGEKATAYICENNTCKPPVIDRSELAYSLGIEK